MLRGLVNHWQLKVLALVLAVGLWFFIGSAERTEIALALPIEYVGLEGALTLDGPRRDLVEVHLEATRWAAERVSPATVRVRVDVARLREGDNIIHLTPDNVQALPGVRVTRVTPSWLTVQAIPAATRTVQVVAQVQGQPASDHVIGPVAVDPPTVQIRGPRTTIEARTVVETLPVDVSGLRTPVTQSVGLALPDSVYPVDRRTVSVSVEIRPEPGTGVRPAGARR